MADLRQVPVDEPDPEFCAEKCAYGECNAPGTFQGCGGCCGCLGPCVVAWERTLPVADPQVPVDESVNWFDHVSCVWCGSETTYHDLRDHRNCT